MMPADRRIRGSELRGFLSERRAQLSPRDVGLSYGRRVVSGLRREDVAELAGVSTRWYEMFECGRSDRRFSVEFVNRVAQALRLNERDRATLFRLALPETATAVQVFEQSARDGAMESIPKIRDFARDAARAESFEEAASAAIEAVQAIIRPDCVTAAIVERPDAPLHAVAVGPHADVADGVLAHAAVCPRSNVTVGHITCFWTEPRGHSASEVSVIETIGAILELVAAK